MGRRWISMEKRNTRDFMSEMKAGRHGNISDQVGWGPTNLLKKKRKENQAKFE